MEEMSLEVSQRPHLIPSMLSLPSANGSGGELSVVPADMPLLPVVESNPLKLSHNNGIQLIPQTNSWAGILASITHRSACLLWPSVAGLLAGPTWGLIMTYTKTFVSCKAAGAVPQLAHLT